MVYYEHLALEFLFEDLPDTLVNCVNPLTGIGSSLK